MSVSGTAKVLKSCSRLIPRKIIATKFSIKASTLNTLEKLWLASKHKKPLFRMGLTSQMHTPDGVLCEWLFKNEEQKNKIVFYLHGGAYLSGTLSQARNRSMRYALNTQASIFIVDYRTSAVAPFPAALNDAISAYGYLCENYPDKEIIMLGDSAGGGLALATVLKIRELGIKMPKKIILNSPWTDLTCSSGTYITKEKSDVVLTKPFLKKCAFLYAGNDYKNPLISPIFADFTEFPPTVIHVGTDEILLDDSRILTENLKRDSVPVKLTEWDGMFHMFHYWENFAGESTKVCKELYQEIGE